MVPFVVQKKLERDELHSPLDNDSETSITRTLSLQSIDSSELDFSSNCEFNRSVAFPSTHEFDQIPKPLMGLPLTSVEDPHIAAVQATPESHAKEKAPLFHSERWQTGSESVQLFKLCFGAAGVYACYLAYGHVQEEIFRYRGSNQERFQQVWFLQVMECACNIMVGIAGRHLCGGRRPTTFLPFFYSGASQVFAKVLTTLSLTAGLSYPVCVLAKSAKIVPVMLGQLLMGGSKFQPREYLFAGLVVLGTCLLSLGKPQKEAPSLSTPAGLLFVFLSLVMDGITGGFQKRLKSETRGKPPTTYDFLLFTNLAMILVAFVISVALGDFGRGWNFCVEHPLMQQMILMVCLLSAMGQSFIFFVVANFDPMVCATVTTTRKILSVLWSITIQSHRISTQGSVGLVLAIVGILMGLQDTLGAGRKNESKTGTKSNLGSMSKEKRHSTPKLDV